MAACLFKPPKYKQFVRRWEQMLKGILPGGALFFHATEFFPGGGIFKDVPRAKRDAIAATLPDLLDEFLHQVIAASFKEDEFIREAPPLWKKRFGSLTGVAVQMCAGGIGHWANERSNNGPIAYVFESGEADEAEAGTAFTNISRSPKIKAHSRYRSHTFTAKGLARGLEAADYFAWHWNKFDAETLSRSVGDPSRRATRKDFHSLVMRNPEKYRVFTFTGPELHVFLTAMWNSPRIALEPLGKSHTREGQKAGVTCAPCQTST